MGERILITGGAGCLGSNLIEHWLPNGHEIFVIDNFATGKREVLPEVKGLTVVEGSVVDQVLVEKCFNDFKPSYVIHSAASYKDPNNWVEDSSTNVLGSINVAKAAKNVNVKRIIHFQTALCYGNPKVVPIPIDHETAPFTSYGISKTAGESYLMQSGVNVTSLRLANICGPRLAIGPIPTFYKRLKAGQSCFCSDTVRDFLDMSDFFALMDILLSDKAKNGIFNVSTGVGSSIKDVFDAVCNYLGLEIDNVPITPPGEDDVAAVVLDPQKTIDDLGWKPQTDFVKTIENQLKWYDQFGVTDIYSHLSASNK